MNLARIAATVAAFCVGCALAGCTPASSQGDIQYRYPAASGLVPDGIKELVRGNAPLTSKQAGVLLPPPERTIAVSELPRFLEGQPGWDEKCIAEEIEGVYRGFLWSKRQRDEEHAKQSAWKDDGVFLECVIWLYNWDKPDEIILGGIPPKKTGIVSSAYILIEGEAVVDAGALTRYKSDR